MGKELFGRSVLLCNGRRVPLKRVIQTLRVLGSLLTDAAGGRHLLYLLREACLGRAGLPEAARSPLHTLGLIPQQGLIPPDVRQVVLAAVHGTGSELFVLPPFTDPWERTVAELFLLQDKVRAYLPTDEADLLIGGPGCDEANTIDALIEWRETGRRPGLRPEDVPPASTN